MSQNFGELPDNARLWLFPLRVPLGEGAATKLDADLNHFVSGWQAHKHQLLAAVELLQNQVIAVAADESQVAASGCSIDALTRAIERIANEEGAEIVRSAEVLYQEAGNFKAVSRDIFQGLVDSGKVQPDTTVIDNTVASLRDLRAGSWRKPMKESWHAKVFLP